MITVNLKNILNEGPGGAGSAAPHETSGVFVQLSESTIKLITGISWSHDTTCSNKSGRANRNVIFAYALVS